MDLQLAMAQSSFSTGSRLTFFRITRFVLSGMMLGEILWIPKAPLS